MAALRGGRRARRSPALRDALVLALLGGCVFLTMLTGLLHGVAQPAMRIVGAGLAAEFGALAEAYRRLPDEQREAYLEAVVQASGGRLVRDDPASWGLGEPRDPLARMLLGRLRATLPGETIAYSEGAQHHYWLALPAHGGGLHWLRVPTGSVRDDLVTASVLALASFALLAPLGALYLARRSRQRASRIGLALDTVSLPDGVSVPPAGAQVTDEDLLRRIEAMAGRLGQLHRDRAVVLQGVATELRRGLEALHALAPEPAAGARALAADLHQLASQLADFAGPDLEEAPQAVELDAVVAQVVAAAARPGRHPGATVVLRLSPLPPLRVRRAAVARALAEVLDNALRHGGPTAEVRSLREGGWLVLQVLDRGEPLTDAELAMLGRPFFRTEAARLRRVGAGLGLAIARRQLEPQSGLLHIGRRAGGGLAVEIRLPLWQGAAR